ncbi:MAG: hypothetical protein ABI977_26670 [Acidobacteriota bacterium]
MKIIFFRCLLIAIPLLIHAGSTAPAQTVKSPPPAKSSKARTAPLPVESFYFLMGDYKMEHQDETNTLNIKISYEYNAGIADNQYPDFIPIRKDVDRFLTNYPNEMTFWEIVNKELTAMILKTYPALSSVTCEIQVTPSAKYQFTRGSIITRHRIQSLKPALSKQNPRRMR